jgi:hypothetical protein
VCATRNDPSLIHAAGTIFVGPWSAQAAGDYTTGSNHVLPTGGAGRFRGGLSTADFVRTFTEQTITRRGLRAIGPAASRSPMQKVSRTLPIDQDPFMNYNAEPPRDGLRLHLNENTAGCSPAVLAALRAIERTDTAFYPEYGPVTALAKARSALLPDGCS